VHEPPIAQVLPDRETALAASRDVHQTYQRSGLGPGMVKFLAVISHKGPIPADFADQPTRAACGVDPHRHGRRAESDGELAHRAAVAVAERLGVQPVTFPSDHGGFLGGEYGQTGDPDAFAATLREVLNGTA
jgi:hypothetical protein